MMNCVSNPEQFGFCVSKCAILYILSMAKMLLLVFKYCNPMGKSFIISVFAFSKCCHCG